MNRFRCWWLASLVFVFSSLASAQETLPTCKGADASRWHSCRGILDDTDFSYAGDFRNGKFEGRGILEFTGEKYSGHYVNGMRHGFGTYTFSNGRAPLSGLWTSNQWTGKAPVSEERAEQKKTVSQ